MIAHPWILGWALCSLTALAAAAWAAARQSLPQTSYRARHANEGRRTAYSRTYAARVGGSIPAPRSALDHTTAPIVITTPTDTHAQHHAAEIDAVLGRRPTLGGTPTMDHTTDNTEHTITTEYEITWNAGSRPSTLVFTGEHAEQSAYDVAELLAATDGGWVMRTRTVHTTVTAAGWIDVARYVTLDTHTETLPAVDFTQHDMPRVE